MTALTQRRKTRVAALLVLAALQAACSSAPLPPAPQRADAGAGSISTDQTPAGADVTGTPGTAAAVVAERAPGGPAGRQGVLEPAAQQAGSRAATRPGRAQVRVPSEPLALFSRRDDRTGITDTQITLCLHAYLSLGKALGIDEDALNVFWNDLNRRGGVAKRSLRMLYADDRNEPDHAVTAATTCRDRNAFLLVGGPGYDQVPAVREWAERGMLYLHDTAAASRPGLRYSFAFMATLERLGESFAEVAATQLAGKKVGIIHRDSENWEPALTAFRRVAEAAGIEIVAEAAVVEKKADYHAEVLRMKDRGAEVVWAWETPLAAAQIISQARAQAYRPQWLVLTSNLLAQGLGEQALDPPLIGVSGSPPYSFGDRTGGFASYAADLAQFEAAYAREGQTQKIDGATGDLLFQAWTAFSKITALLQACGRGCTRNALAEVMRRGYATTVVGCPLDFSRDGRHGALGVYVSQAYRARAGVVNFRPTSVCRSVPR
jgi:ABC-type branched-subunit amino acid transport system substrate-binding protein